MEIFGIVKINKFLDFFQFAKKNLEILQLSILWMTALLAILPILIFFHCQLSQFLFSILVTRKFRHSTSERSLICKFETSAILKFYCLKFWPSSAIPKFRNIGRSTLNRWEFRPPPSDIALFLLIKIREIDKLILLQVTIMNG